MLILLSMVGIMTLLDEEAPLGGPCEGVVVPSAFELDFRAPAGGGTDVESLALLNMSQEVRVVVLTLEVSAEGSGYSFHEQANFCEPELTGPDLARCAVTLQPEELRSIPIAFTTSVDIAEDNYFDRLYINWRTDAASSEDGKLCQSGAVTLDGEEIR